jgi:Cupredoxin-like domain
MIRVSSMRNVALALLVAGFALSGPQSNAGAQEFTVTIRNHKFEPTELRIPANKRVTVYVVNEDPTPEEFESTSMKVEKIIPGKSKGLVRIGPLTPGRYEFFGDFNQATAQGVVIAE